jgi:cellulose synthase/poly-beta-1,6-N-acetylglucosamine synthase-like glycosyltransferase
LSVVPLLLQLDGPVYLIAICLLFVYAVRYYVFAPISLVMPKRRSNPAETGGESLPFVSIILPLYNERNVVERLLTACTSTGYPNYEVIVVDDSNDGTTAKLEKWKACPSIKIFHRANREGWKGGALNLGIANVDPRSTHVLVFDADFVPPKGIIEGFLAHFSDPKVQVVQGYQKHDLNADENWITKGVRIFHSATYKVELEARAKLGMMVPVMGSVFMVRTNLLKTVKFDADITEDYNLTLRLYLRGYKVVYDSSLAASGECPASIPRVFRQIGRWAEGTTRNSKNFFWNIMGSKQLSLREKFDFIVTGFSYLSAIILLVATGVGMANLIFVPSRYLVSYPPLLAASILMSFAIPAAVAAQAIGLFRDRAGLKLKTLPCSMLLSYLLVPVTSYYSLKGLLTKQKLFERTFKTGMVVRRTVGSVPSFINPRSGGPFMAKISQRFTRPRDASSWFMLESCYPMNYKRVY